MQVDWWLQPKELCSVTLSEASSGICLRNKSHFNGMQCLWEWGKGRSISVPYIHIYIHLNWYFCCKFRRSINFGESVCHLMSTWLVLFMTIERFIAVRYPFKKDLLCRPRGVIIAILVVFSAMSYSQIYRLIMIESGGGACWASDRYRKVYLLLYIYGYQGVMFLLPALLILIFNILIIANIRRLSSIEQSGCAFESNPRYAENKERRAKLYNKTTVVLLLISFMHLLTQLPHLILSLFIYGPPDRKTLHVLAKQTQRTRKCSRMLLGDQLRVEFLHLRSVWNQVPLCSASHVGASEPNDQTNEARQDRKSVLFSKTSGVQLT